MKELHLKNIVKSYIQEGFSVRVENLEIKKGEFFGLLGSSGCGKTTVLKLIAGLLDPDTGTIDIEDNNITMVFQQPLLFPHLTIEKNIEFGLKMKKVDKTLRKILIDKYLKVVGLENYNKRYPSELSGGQQQRVSIARAMVLEPSVLLMDEPFSALDPYLREDMRNLILKIHSETKMTIVFVTHDIDEAFELFDRMALLDEGKIIEVGTPLDIYEKPSDVYSARFLKSNNIIELPFDELNLYGEYRYAVIRPEAFEIEKHIGDTDDFGIGFIEDIKLKRGLQYSYIKLKGTTLEVLTKTNHIEKFSVGESVKLKYNNKDIHYIK